MKHLRPSIIEALWSAGQRPAYPQRPSAGHPAETLLGAALRIRMPLMLRVATFVTRDAAGLAVLAAEPTAATHPRARR
ncbi:MAG: hypothetical protein DLM67_10290 [Candidatus Nephthysia bennettiae]|nr:MAG: hypothetical protein DLM67_10290 [Candidatus Dormibacteraeota bacterium]